MESLNPVLNNLAESASTNEVQTPELTNSVDARLFTDKYYPKSLQDLDYNFELNRELINLAKVKDLPHLMFCGIPGAGKKTRAMLFLRERFGLSVMRVKKKEVSFKYSNKPIDFQLLYSNYHYQIDPSIHGVYDRSIIQDLVKKIMQLQLGITDMSVGSHKVIVVENADRLTQEAQQSLRRTLELYVKSCRFIFLVNNEGNMIEPLQSRCLKLRVPAPSTSDIRGILENIAITENIQLSDKSLEYLIRYSDKNLNTLINQLQILNLKSPNRLSDPNGISIQEISDIHAHIKMMVDTIFTGTNLSILMTIRQYVYDLLVNCVIPTEIIKLIFEEVLTRIPDSGFKYKYEIIKIAKKYDHTIRLGSKPIYHIEAMVVHLFNMIKMIQQKIKPTNSGSIPIPIPGPIPGGPIHVPVTVNASSNPTVIATGTGTSTATYLNNSKVLEDSECGNGSSSGSNGNGSSSSIESIQGTSTCSHNVKVKVKQVVKRGPKLKPIVKEEEIATGEKIKIKVKPKVMV
jgi:replication factor C subunit 3/5